MTNIDERGWYQVPPAPAVRGGEVRPALPRLRAPEEEVIVALDGHAWWERRDAGRGALSRVVVRRERGHAVRGEVRHGQRQRLQEPEQPVRHDRARALLD